MGRYTTDKQTQQVENSFRKGSRITDRGNKPKSLKEQFAELEKRNQLKKKTEEKSNDEEIRYSATYVPSEMIEDIEKRIQDEEEMLKRKRANERLKRKEAKEALSKGERKLIPVKDLENKK